MIDRACISLNHRCNLRCKYCHFSGKEIDVDAERYEFTPAQVEQITENIAEYCAVNNIEKFKLGIVGSGEPLLSYPALKRIVERVRQIGEGRIAVYTITNGTILSKETAEFFYANKDIIDVNFSLDGYEQLHNEMRCEYRKTWAAISLYEQVFNRKPLVNATVTRKTIDNADKVISFFTDNGFDKVNFSIVSDVENPSIKITQAEYEAFLDKCSERGLIMRQKRDNAEKVYDCAKYGRLCGVGRTNIFITKQGIYPCGRFFGLGKYRIADFNAKLQDVENSFERFKPLSDGRCYYDAYVGKQN